MWCCRLIISALVVTGCSSGPTAEEMLRGTIAYPFQATDPLGKNGPDQKFVIKSSVGDTMYSIEIPGAAEDFDIEIPLAALDHGALGGPERPRDLSHPAATDRELVAALPQIADRTPKATSLMDKAFGTAPKEGPSQSPSYSLGLAKISKLYARRRYEFALIEINHLLTFYPNSPRLHKMKGTVMIKMRNFPLAIRSWEKAVDLAPEDRILKKGLLQLRSRYAPDTQEQAEEAAEQFPVPEIAPAENR